ncbi:AMP-binding protein [Aromatoleum aromaticum]|uniref:Putative 4-isopropylbenzoate-CoA ligase n=1 Tax=Aromatoleum aromaticum TaxID=551760 RepID=A0A096ZNX7_9RHOO|nr:AMP-binding protein [Aromatoleum aromaticum]AIS23705.1 putative 4-isopropylbenzoate-CoA ligase [Aromatoleum aromaticum]NMG55172.1 AMP-binding protein [Aromatoleum aromaticum]
MWLHSEIKSPADIVRYYGKKFGDRIALIAGAEKRTFGELDRTSNQVANAVAAAGFASDMKIGFLGRNSIFYFEALFGVWKAGAVFLPLNWRLAAPELAVVIDDARPSLIFVDKEFSDLLVEATRACKWTFTTVEFDSASAAGSLGIDWSSAAGDADPCIALPPEQCAVLLYTSGTSGVPKGVQLTHGAFNFMRLSEHLDNTYSWQDHDVMLMAMPGFHLVGLGLAIQALYNGAGISILAGMDPGSVLEVIVRDRVTVGVLVPTALQMLLAHEDLNSTDFSSLRLLMYAGSAIDSAVLTQAIKVMNCDFLQFYGSSESWTLTLLRPFQHDPDCEEQRNNTCKIDCGGRLRSCGTPPPLVELKIVDSYNQEVAVGTVGEILARSPTLFSGYLNQADTTSRVLVDGWYKTGDAGFRCPSGLYFLVDRVKDMVVTGGENVYSIEVEQALAKHPDVIQSAVIGLPDEQWGEKVVAYVTLRTGASATPAELIAHCRNLIARYKSPKEVYCVEQLPMTQTGKVKKQELRRRATSK